MKLKHKKLIDKSYLKYAHLSELCPKVPCLYYLMGLAALKYRNENRTGIIYYRFSGSIDLGTHIWNYSSFKVLRNLENLDTWEITVKIITSKSYESYGYYIYMF